MTSAERDYLVDIAMKLEAKTEKVENKHIMKALVILIKYIVEDTYEQE